LPPLFELFEAVDSFDGFSALADFDEAAGFSDAVDFSGAADFSLDAAFSLDFAFDFETVTIDEILSIVEAGTPAFERSATEEYGRPSMIFFAYAEPMPGSASSCSWVAVFRSTFEDLLLAAKPCAAGRRSSAATTARNRCTRIFE
jgi:hypothetical protein